MYHKCIDTFAWSTSSIILLHGPHGAAAQANDVANTCVLILKSNCYMHLSGVVAVNTWYANTNQTLIKKEIRTHTPNVV